MFPTFYRRAVNRKVILFQYINVQNKMSGFANFPRVRLDQSRLISYLAGKGGDDIVHNIKVAKEKYM